MAAVSFQMLDHVTLLPVDIDADGDIYVSAEQNNDSGTTYNALKCICDYINLQSTDGSASVTAVVESRSAAGSDWYPLAYQFNSFSKEGVKQSRQVIMAPNMFWFDAGIDNIIWVDGKGTVAQISNSQAELSPYWRIRIALNDPNSTFTSLEMSLYGERYQA